MNNLKVLDRFSVDENENSLPLMGGNLNLINIPNFQSLKDISNVEEKDLVLWLELSEKISELYDFLNFVNTDKSISYQIFHDKMWSFLDDIHNFTNDLEIKDLKQKQLFFRGTLYSLLNQSVVFSRALSKPYGYPGDFIMLQTLYDGKPISDTKLGQYLDQFFFDDELAKAVVNRVEVMGDRVIKFINESQKDEIHILNIASGSGFELKKIIKQNFNKKVVYHCFDQELASLSYINKNIKGKNPNVELRLYKEDIKVFFRRWKNEKKFDFIYNIGLADYLPDRILSSLVSECLENLNDEGIFVLAHKDYTLFPYHHPAWLYDWNFIHRNLEQYKELLKSITKLKFDIWFESKRKVVYFSEFKKSDLIG